MNAVSTMTTKGQVTIPLAIREALGLDTGTRISFELEGGELRVRPISTKTWNDFWDTAEGTPKLVGRVDVDAAIQAAVDERISRKSRKS